MNNDFYTKEELIKYLFSDTEDYNRIHYYKLMNTIVHKILGSENEIYILSEQEKKRLNSDTKTECLELMLSVSKNINFNIKNDMIKQIEKRIIEIGNENYSFVKEKYINNLFYYFIREKEEYKIISEYIELDIDDVVNHYLKNNSTDFILENIFTSPEELNEEKVEEFINKIKIQEESKQKILSSFIVRLLNNNYKKTLINFAFYLVEDKEKLFNTVKNKLLDYPSFNKKMVYLENIYLSSKIQDQEKNENQKLKKRI